MNFASQLKNSSQLLLTLVILFGFQYNAQGRAASTEKFQPIYKVERCDCFGFSDDVPVFLSDLSGATNLDQLDINAQGRTINAAESKAQRMCAETYRIYAKTSKNEQLRGVTQSGCTKLKSTPDGRWVSL